MFNSHTGKNLGKFQDAHYKTVVMGGSNNPNSHLNSGETNALICSRILS